MNTQTHAKLVSSLPTPSCYNAKIKSVLEIIWVMKKGSKLTSQDRGNETQKDKDCEIRWDENEERKSEQYPLFKKHDSFGSVGNHTHARTVWRRCRGTSTACNESQNPFAQNPIAHDRLLLQSALNLEKITRERQVEQRNRGMYRA